MYVSKNNSEKLGYIQHKNEKLFLLFVFLGYKWWNDDDVSSFSQ